MYNSDQFQHFPLTNGVIDERYFDLNVDRITARPISINLYISLSLSLPISFYSFLGFFLYLFNFKKKAGSVVSTERDRATIDYEEERDRRNQDLDEFFAHIIAPPDIVIFYSFY